MSDLRSATPCAGPVERDARSWLGARVVALAAAVLLLILSTAVGPSPALADASDEGNLVVDVTDGVEPRPTPTRRPVTPPGPPRGLGNVPHPAPQDTQATIPDPVAADDALGDAATFSGPIAMSGLTATATPSLGIGNGTLTLSFVVRNTSEEPVDSTARFWVNDVLGNGVADIDAVQVDALESGETRRVLVTIDGLGQHTVLRSYVTFVPPETIDGQPVSPITRNTVAFVAPLFSMSLVSGIGAVSGLAWWAVSSRGLGLRLRRPGV